MNHVETDIQVLNQITNKTMVVGVLNIEKLRKIVKFSERVSIELDPFDNEDNMIVPNSYYQRLWDSERAYKIKLYLLKQLYNLYSFENNQVSPLAVFPASIILACHSYPEEISEKEFMQDLNLIENKELYEYSYISLESKKIIVPACENSLIVDGQHRVIGFMKLYEELLDEKLTAKKSDLNLEFIKNLPPYSFLLDKIKEFKFLVTFLIDFDRYEQAELFATVNFNQKPVNKSYLYDIFGSAERGKTIEKLLHDLTSHLNYNKQSPLYQKIKMLGKGNGFFSQAFFVEAMLPLFKKGIFNDILIDFQNDGKRYEMLPMFLREYFNAFSIVFSDFVSDNPKGNKSLLHKTTGMGAIILLMPTIYKKLKEVLPSGDILDSAEGVVEKEIISILTKIKSNGSVYFSSESYFAGGAGKGLQSRLYKKMLIDLNGTNEINYQF